MQPNPPSKRGVKSRFTPQTKAQIKELMENGASDEDIACAYCVHRTTVGRLRKELITHSADKPLGPLQRFLADYADHMAAVDSGEPVELDPETCYCMQPDCNRCWGTGI